MYAESAGLSEHPGLEAVNSRVGPERTVVGRYNTDRKKVTSLSLLVLLLQCSQPGNEHCLFVWSENREDPKRNLYSLLNICKGGLGSTSCNDTLSSAISVSGVAMQHIWGVVFLTPSPQSLTFDIHLTEPLMAYGTLVNLMR